MKKTHQELCELQQKAFSALYDIKQYLNAYPVFEIDLGPKFEEQPFSVSNLITKAHSGVDLMDKDELAKLCKSVSEDPTDCNKVGMLIAFVVNSVSGNKAKTDCGNE